MRQGRKAKNAIDCFSCNPSLSLESESGQGHSLDPSSSLEPPSPRRTNTVDLKLPHSKWNLEKVFHLLLTGPHRSRRYRPGCRRMGCGLSWEPPRPHHAASPNIPRQSSIAVNAVHASHCAFPGPLLFTSKHKQARPRPGPRSCEKLRPAKRGVPVRRLESSPIHHPTSSPPHPHSPPQPRTPPNKPTQSSFPKPVKKAGHAANPTPPPSSSSLLACRFAWLQPDSSPQPGITPSLRPALHPVWLVPYPPQHRTTCQYSHWDLEAHPQARRKTRRNSCLLPRPALHCSLSTALLSTNELAANSNHPPRPVLASTNHHRPIDHLCHLHTPATHLLSLSSAERLSSRYLWAIRYQKSTPRGSLRTSTKDGKQDRRPSRGQQSGHVIAR